MTLSYLNLKSTDPELNLATEQYVFDCMPRDRAYFMLWQNDNAIIIGKYQNTISEINQEYIIENGIKVVRRLSGGGAVYHDLGNLNFTFIADAGDVSSLNFKLFCEPVIQTLATLGIKAEINGRNDMTIDGRKFSGNSQYIRNGRVMHHGTILFNSDLSILSKALKVNEEKIKSKGTKSIRSRVTNVSEYLNSQISVDEFRNILLSNVISACDSSECFLNSNDQFAIQHIKHKRYSTWDWNYGESPTCAIHQGKYIEGCGQIDVDIDVEHGKIVKVKFHGDFFSIKEPEELAALFVGYVPNTIEYEKIVSSVDVSQFFVGLTNQEFLKLLCE